MRRETLAALVESEKAFTFLCGIMVGTIAQLRNLTPLHCIGMLAIILLYSKIRLQQAGHRENVIPSVLALGIGFCFSSFSLKLARSWHTPDDLKEPPQWLNLD